MSNMIPTAEQLKPLYNTAVAYGRASVRESEIYLKAGHKMTPALRRASRVRDQRYWAIPPHGRPSMHSFRG